MIKTPMSLQDLQRKIYGKAKAAPSWRFWGLYAHVCKMETLRAAYRVAKANDGAPGIDGVRFEDIEASGVEPFLEQRRDELVARTYHPMRVRRKAIPTVTGRPPVAAFSHACISTWGPPLTASVRRKGTKTKTAGQSQTEGVDSSSQFGTP